MNLVWRMIWMWIAARIAVRMGAHADIMGEGRLVFRCLPTDLDFNLHMTNSRYNSFADLSRVSFILRTGVFDRLRHEGFFPVLGSSTMRFRRPIALFERFAVTTRILTWDEKWIYLLHRFETAKDVPAVGAVKVAFVGRGGRAPVERVVDLMRYTGPKPESPVAKEITDLDDVLKA